MVPFLAGAAIRITWLSYAEFLNNPERAAEAYYAVTQVIGGDVVFCFGDLSIEAVDFGQDMVYPPNDTAHPDYSKPRIATTVDY